MAGLQTSQTLLDRVTQAFAGARGVHAVVLGGSRGRGSHHEGSDYDIGLYYAGDLDTGALERAARALTGDTRTTPARLMTDIGGWGAWVNGGGWLTVDGTQVDILYRDAQRVERVIGDCLAGKFECAYHHGHPHGFISTIYAGEIALCRVLHDPGGIVAAQKARLLPYPGTLKTALIARFLDEARFFLAVAAKASQRADVNHVAGCAFRAASCLLQVLFACNEEWLINEKGALALADNFAVKPVDLKARLERAYSNLVADGATLGECLRQIGELVNETAALAAR